MNKVKTKRRRLILLFLLILLAVGIFVLINTLFRQNFDIREKASSEIVGVPVHTTKPKNTPKPKPTKTPISSPYPTASSCSSVSITGGSYGGIVNGKALYYIASGSKVTLAANTTPPNGLVNWKIASFSYRLPNGGSLSTNNAPTVVYTAPVNSSGSDQGVEIRGDISEYPNPWIYCPPITFAIHTR